jgi:hypothetical protein
MQSLKAVYGWKRRHTQFGYNVRQLHSALTQLEGNTFTLLGLSEAFAHQARRLLQQLTDYRVTSRKLTREAERLARGRVRLGDGAGHAAPTTLLEDGDLTMLRAPSLAEERAAHVHGGQ